MAETQSTPERIAVRRQGELSQSYARYESGREELNREFLDPLRTYRQKYGGGACTGPTHERVDEPAILTLIGRSRSGETDGHTVRLEEGDVATVTVGTTEFRIKLFGLRRDSRSPFSTEQGSTAVFSLDVWDDGVWREVAGQLEADSALDWQYGDETVRVVNVGSSLLGTDQGVEALIDAGSDPDQAIDYWMVARRGLSPSEWADRRGVSETEVSENVERVRDSSR